MSEHDAVGRVVSVLLADGWHRVVPGSFAVRPLCFGGGELGWPGFRFEEADAGSPYPPKELAGPLDSIIAIRQVGQDIRRIVNPDRTRAAHNGHPGPGTPLPVRTGR